MKQLGIIVALAFTLAMVPKSTLAEPAQSTTVDPWGSYLTRRLWLYAGVDLGFSLLNTSVEGEENKSGLGGNLRFMASRYWDKWVADGGFGFGYKSISGLRPTGFEGTLETRTLLVEIALRRRLTPRLDLGTFLVAHTLADVSHRPTTAPLIVDEPEKRLIFMTGLQGMYQLTADNNPMRAGFRIATDLDIPRRRLWEFQAVFQIGFPVGPTAVARVHDDRKVEYYEVPILRIQFKLNSDELTDTSIAYLIQIGRFFAKNKEQFTRIEVEGHTDQIGSYTYNIDLSQRRAEAVANVLKKQGVPAAMLLPRGYGYTKPLSLPPNQSTEKNRRVAVRIVGASEDKKAFFTELRELVK